MLEHEKNHRSESYGQRLAREVGNATSVKLRACAQSAGVSEQALHDHAELTCALRGSADQASCSLQQQRSPGQLQRLVGAR